ncbi:MAG: integrase core domain-containing protein [Vulcanimicrobiaceae bacterium]
MSRSPFCMGPLAKMEGCKACLKMTITAWVKDYNETRPHSRLHYLPPVEWRHRQGELSA